MREGATLYVLDAPQNLLLFGDESRLRSLGGLYFGDAVLGYFKDI